jgi:hypothetical protein
VGVSFSPGDQVETGSLFPIAALLFPSAARQTIPILSLSDEKNNNLMRLMGNK